MEGGTRIALPQQETWSWTKPNDSVRKAIENLLWWRKGLAVYFGNGVSIVNAYESDETGQFAQRLTLEMIQEPLLGHSKKLVLTVAISRNNIGKPSYSASGYEEPVFPLPRALFGTGYHRLNETDVQARSDSNAAKALGVNAIFTFTRTKGIESRL